MKLHMIISGICFFSISAFSQQGDSVSLQFVPVVNHFPLVPDSSYRLSDGSTMRLETLKFYVTGLQLLQDHQVVFEEENSFHLVDIRDTTSLTVKIKVPSGPDYDQIVFQLGIDSTTSVAGARGGDLDPVHGMYWTWQSGYINLKLEGYLSSCQSADHSFELHLGGYRAPYQAQWKILLDTHDQNPGFIYIDMDRMLSGSGIKAHHHVMSPGMEAVKLSAWIASCFKSNDL
jgi:hypothetical protein